MQALGAAFVIASLFLPRLASAQPAEPPFRLGALIATVSSSEFDTAETGLGALLAWHPTPMVGAEVEVAVHPEDLGRPAFSSGRVETLFGVTIGAPIGRLRPFAKVRPGILRFWKAPEPLACIAIFPSPVQCTLAAGKTVVGLDIGGGLELSTARRTFVRAEVGDRLLSFPGPVRDRGGRAREDGYFAHDLRIAVGGGWRF
jgi:hypothetical protein